MKKKLVVVAALASFAMVASSPAAFAASTPAHPPQPTPAARSGIQTQDIAAATAQFPYVRTPAMAVTDRGTVIAAYDPRPSGADLPSHMPLVIRRSTDNGRTWGPAQTVRSAPAPAGFSDPSLLVDHKTGRIFLFYAASVNEGYFGSHTGNSDTDPNILQADVSYSDDDGATWTNETITSQIKNPSWNGLFAASGEGIQLTTGAHAGRLVQQYVVGIGSRSYAASAYSDDDGATWKMGALVGPGMNENKTVQLANGDVLLDVRAAPYRLLATSTDGGVTYSQPIANTQLPDPSDNGSIIRYAPQARPGSAEADWLLESNTADTSSRRNLVVKLSCDNGQTWPVTKVIDPGSAGYSTLTNLRNGQFGLLYERDDYTKMTYASFGRDFIRPSCGEITPAAGGAAPVLHAGAQTIPVTVTDTGTTPLAAGTLRLAAPSGWTTQPVRLPRLQPGWKLTVPVPVTIGSHAASGTLQLAATYTTPGGQSQGTIPATLLNGTPVWSAGPVTTDGVHAVDETSHLPAVRTLTGGTIAVTFHTTQSAPAAVLLSAADPTSNVRDLVVSLNSGHPYVEIRTDTNTYPVRISSSAIAADGQTHTVTVTSNASGTVLALDGTVIGSTTTPAFFDTVPGLANLTLGANIAQTGTRWQFNGTIDTVAVYPGRN